MRVFDTGAYLEQYPFFVAEFLPKTLSSLISLAEVSIVERLSYAIQLLSALVYLQTLAVPVVHRDIKPANLFLKGHSCVLGDFGLHKAAHDDSDEDREFFKESLGPGMPFRYRTPDLVAYYRDGSPLTTKSDVFQLGLVLAELFTGRNPHKPARDFRDDVQLEPLERIQDPASELIVNLLEDMLKMDPRERSSASDLISAWDGIFEALVIRERLQGRSFFR